MKVVNLERKFKYNSVTLPDPNTAMSIEQVREFYATQYPELNNAVSEGPVTSGSVSTWTFMRAVGSKGRANNTVESDSDARKMLQALMSARQEPSGSKQIAQASQEDLLRMSRLRDVVHMRPKGKAMSLPTSAFGIWG